MNLTFKEHGGGLAVWLHWQAAGIINDIDKVEMPGPDASEDDVVALFSAALSAKRYRVLAVSHVLTTTVRVTQHYKHTPTVLTFSHINGERINNPIKDFKIKIIIMN